MVVSEVSPCDSDAGARSHDALGAAVEGYRRRRGGFPETLNAEDLRLETVGCRDPYSGRLFEYFSRAGEYVLRASPFWERREGWVLGFSPPDLAWRFPATKASLAEAEEWMELDFLCALNALGGKSFAATSSAFPVLAGGIPQNIWSKT